MMTLFDDEYILKTYIADALSVTEKEVEEWLGLIPR